MREGVPIVISERVSIQVEKVIDGIWGDSVYINRDQMLSTTEGRRMIVNLDTAIFKLQTYYVDGLPTTTVCIPIKDENDVTRLCAHDRLIGTNLYLHTTGAIRGQGWQT